MKKSNVIITVILALISIGLLWLWFYLGLNHVDEPLDLILSIVWWVVIVLVIVAILKIEKTRRARVRTMYVGDEAFFSSETGLVSYPEKSQLITLVEGVLKDLTYGFRKQDTPDPDQFTVRAIIRTTDMGDDIWEGTVVNVATKEEKSFETREELAALLA